MQIVIRSERDGESLFHLVDFIFSSICCDIFYFTDSFSLFLFFCLSFQNSLLLCCIIFHVNYLSVAFAVHFLIWCNSEKLQLSQNILISSIVSAHSSFLFCHFFLPSASDCMQYNDFSISTVPLHCKCGVHFESIAYADHANLM